MNISRRSFVIGGTAAVAAAGMAPMLSSCATGTKSGLDFAKFETNGVKTLNTGLHDANGSGVPTKLYNITNKQGAELCVTNFGARLVSLMMPDKNGDFKDMILGFDDIRKYANYDEMPMNFYGATCGRFGNRIKDGKWTYKGQTYQVDINENDNSLHGGKFGFHNQTFEVKDYAPSSYIQLELISEMGEMGFPGRMTVNITYTLNDNNTVGVFYEASTTQSCPVNMLSHAFWCPSGDPSQPITEQNLTIYSDAYTPIDNELIPTGEIASIPENSVFDFFCNGEGKLIGKDINANDQQLKNGKGYDHNFVIMSNDKLASKGVSFDGKFEITDDGSHMLTDKAQLAAKVSSPDSGITMTITTSEPAIQFFDFHNMGDPVGKHGKTYGKYAALALEPQHFPDSPNQPNFPNTIVKPGEVYRSKSEFHFAVQD